MDLKKYKPTLPETARLWRRMLYNKIENIFIFENLPKEIPVRFFNLCLFKTGKMVFYKIGDKFCVQPFTYTDILDWYYVPVSGRVVNPYLPKAHNNWEFTINDEAVIYNSSADIYNGRTFSVVADLIYKTANQLSENDISYYCISRNSRLLAILTAETDLQKREMDKILDKMYRGETDITMEENLVSHVHANPLTQNSTRNSLTELIEFQQYILANFYHNFGINSNYNLKREQLNSDEINVNQEVLRLNIEDMLKNREDGVSKINEKYGLNISVSLNEKLYATLLQLTEQMLNSANSAQNGVENDGTDRISEDNGKRVKPDNNGSTGTAGTSERTGLGDSETGRSDKVDNRHSHSGQSDNEEEHKGNNKQSVSEDEKSNTEKGSDETPSNSVSSDDGDDTGNDKTNSSESVSDDDKMGDNGVSESVDTPAVIINITSPTTIKTEENENDERRTERTDDET